MLHLHWGSVVQHFMLSKPLLEAAMPNLPSNSAAVAADVSHRLWTWERCGTISLSSCSGVIEEAGRKFEVSGPLR